MNRLRTVTRKSDSKLIATYSYDADGRRTSSTITNSGALNGTTYFYLDGQQEIEEHNAGNVLTQQYVYGVYIDEPLVLGGVSILGGSGTIGGVVIAAFVMGLVTFGLGLLNVPGIVMSIFIGLLLIITIALPIVARRIKAMSSK